MLRTVHERIAWILPFTNSVISPRHHVVVMIFWNCHRNYIINSLIPDRKIRNIFSKSRTEHNSVEENYVRKIKKKAEKYYVLINVLKGFPSFQIKPSFLYSNVESSFIKMIFSPYRDIEPICFL